MNSLLKSCPFFILTAVIPVACVEKSSSPSKDLISQLELKRGQVISCGSPNQEFGIVDFDIGGSAGLKKDFNTAVELLHSFEYEEAEKVFANIIDHWPNCAMAYWGVAMCNFHPLWEPPSEADLEKGSKAIEIAKSINEKSDRESGYINAVAAYYGNWSNTNAHNRSINFEKAMEQLHRSYPNDKEAAIFYALALDASADATDKTYANQKKPVTY